MTPLNNDILSEDDMRAIMHETGFPTEFISMTTATGTTEYIENDQSWLNDLIEADNHLHACLAETRFLDLPMLAQPVAYNSDNYTLRGDTLLESLIEAFVVLETIFNVTTIGQLYRPSPYATSFLCNFQDCAFLHTCLETDTPSMTWADAERAVNDLNHRLLNWRAYISKPGFHYQCRRAYRNSQENRSSLKEWIDELFQSHAYLQVLRVDLGYRKEIATHVTYEKTSAQRARLCKAFHYNPLFKHMVGYAWKLEWGNSRGFHYHFLFFFDASQVKNDVIRAQWIGELWSRTITNGEGTYYNCNSHADTKYFYNALGKVGYHDTHKAKGLEYIANYLTKEDEYASLAVSGKTFFHSRTPPRPRGPRLGRPRQYPSVY